MKAIKTILITVVLLSICLLFNPYKKEAKQSYFVPGSIREVKGTNTSKYTTLNEQDIVDITNTERAQNGLSTLRRNDKLDAAALAKAQDMIQKNYWAHYGPNGETPWQFIIGADYKYAYAGENLGKGFSDSDSLVKAWMNSETHKENILDKDFGEIGIAVINNGLDGTTLVVQMFGNTSYSR